MNMKMVVKGVRIEWYKGYNNDPILEVCVEQLPSHEDMLFEERNGIYYAEYKHCVRFYYYEQPGEGFGGSVFKLEMKDGSKKELFGPWSSRSECVNAEGFGPCVECIFYVGSFNSLGYSGAITIERASELVEAYVSGRIEYVKEGIKYVLGKELKEYMENKEVDKNHANIHN